MPFISTIPDAEATGDVRRMYEEQQPDVVNALLLDFFEGIGNE